MANSYDQEFNRSFPTQTEGPEFSPQKDSGKNGRKSYSLAKKMLMSMATAAAAALVVLSPLNFSVRDVEHTSALFVYEYDVQNDTGDGTELSYKLYSGEELVEEGSIDPGSESVLLDELEPDTVYTLRIWNGDKHIKTLSFRTKPLQPVDFGQNPDEAGGNGDDYEPGIGDGEEEEPEGSPEPSASATPEPTATASPAPSTTPTPTPTPTPSATPSPTPAPLPPAPIPSPEPTPTPAPTAAPEITPPPYPTYDPSDTTRPAGTISSAGSELWYTDIPPEATLKLSYELRNPPDSIVTDVKVYVTYPDGSVEMHHAPDIPGTDINGGPVDFDIFLNHDKIKAWAEGENADKNLTLVIGYKYNGTSTAIDGGSYEHWWVENP